MKKALYIMIAVATMAMVGCQKDDEKRNDNNHNGNNDGARVEAEMPRFLCAHDGKVYASCYDPCCVVRIDTTTLKVEALCRLGGFHPEGLCVVGNKLYITSGSISDEDYNYYYDNKVYVVDIATFAVCDSLTTGYNPERIIALDGHRVVVSYRGDYGANPEGCDVIDVLTKQTTPLSTDLYKFDLYQGNLYGYSVTYDANWNPTNKFYRIDVNNLQATEILTDFPAADHAYGININPFNGDIIVMTDGNYISNGDVYVYQNNGSLRREACEAMSMPSKAVAVNSTTLLILNEGSWGYNDSELSLFNTASGQMNNNAFAQSNGRGLGDVGQDLLHYGSKIYATVSCSNSIEVMEANNSLHSTQIRLR